MAYNIVYAHTIQRIILFVNTYILLFLTKYTGLFCFLVVFKICNDDKI